VVHFPAGARDISDLHRVHIGPGTDLSPHSLDTVAFVLVAGGCGAKMIGHCIHCVCETDKCIGRRRGSVMLSGEAAG